MDEFAQAAFREREARKILRRRIFFVHASVYVATNAFIVAIWFLSGKGHPWFLYPLLAWGIGLIAHGATAFLLESPADVVLERERRRLSQDGG